MIQNRWRENAKEFFYNDKKLDYKSPIKNAIALTFGQEWQKYISYQIIEGKMVLSMAIR